MQNKNIISSSILARKKGPIHDPKIHQYIEAKNGHQNFDWIFDRVWEIFLSKNTLTRNIDGSNLFDIF